MAISETKMQMVIANYFKDECDVNTSIRQAFEKGFRIGVKKGAISANRPQGGWILSKLQSQADNDNGNYAYVCTNCHHTDIHAKTQEVPYCWYCGARMRPKLQGTHFDSIIIDECAMKGADDE